MVAPGRAAKNVERSHDDAHALLGHAAMLARVLPAIASTDDQLRTRTARQW